MTPADAEPCQRLNEILEKEREREKVMLMQTPVPESLADTERKGGARRTQMEKQGNEDTEIGMETSGVSVNRMHQ